MPGDVKPKRPYNSTRRRAQAEETRRTILDAALTLFSRDGYVATTVEAIAAEAGVSAKTVYDAFTNKPGLLRAAWDLALKGDADDAPVAARPWYVALLDEPEPAAMVRAIAANSVAVKQRVGPMFRVIRDASSVDADSAALWSLIQSDFHENQRVLVGAIAKRKGLRKGLSVARATDILWALNHPNLWLMLHEDRGWSAAEFQRWLTESLTYELLAT